MNTNQNPNLVENHNPSNIGNIEGNQNPNNNGNIEGNGNPNIGGDHNSNIGGDHNSQNNITNNINIVSLGNENLSEVLTTQEKLGILKQKEQALDEIIKYTHFNKKFPVS